MRSALFCTQHGYLYDGRNSRRLLRQELTTARKHPQRGYHPGDIADDRQLPKLAKAIKEMEDAMAGVNGREIDTRIEKPVLPWANDAINETSSNLSSVHRSGDNQSNGDGGQPRKHCCRDIAFFYDLMPQPERGQLHEYSCGDGEQRHSERREEDGIQQRKFGHISLQRVQCGAIRSIGTTRRSPRP